MTPDELVQAYHSALVDCGWAIRRQYRGASRVAVAAPLTLFGVDEGVRVSAGHVNGFGEFKMHGAGCRFVLASGAVVDFDWDPDGRMVFDAWRLLKYAESLGLHPSQEDLLAAASSSPILTETRPGWFATA